MTKECYTIKELPSMKIVGIECRTSNDPERGPHDIPKLWGQFAGENIFSQIPNKASAEVIGLYCDYEADYTKPYSLAIGCPVSSADELPEGLVKKTVPAATYAVFPVEGELPAGIVEAWGKIWQTPLKRTYTGDFERYGELVEIYIAIEK